MDTKMEVRQGTGSVVEDTTLKDSRKVKVTKHDTLFLSTDNDRKSAFLRAGNLDKAADTDVQKTEHERGSKVGFRGGVDSEHRVNSRRDVDGWEVGGVDSEHRVNSRRDVDGWEVGGVDSEHRVNSRRDVDGWEVGGVDSEHRVNSRRDVDGWEVGGVDSEHRVNSRRDVDGWEVGGVDSEHRVNSRRDVDGWEVGGVDSEHRVNSRRDVDGWEVGGVDSEHRVNSRRDVDGWEVGAVAADNGDIEAAGSRDVKDTVVWKVPDGGYGWVIVLSALVISLIVDGLTYTFGVLLGELERVFQEPKSTISLASSLQVGLYLFIGPVVSALTNRFGCRAVIIAGSFVAAFAFIISSWSTNVTMLIMTYGFIGGIGFGLMYLPAIVAVSVYFEERRAFATGVAVCGSGIGTFILAPLTDFLLYEYNWSWTLLLLGALILNGIVFGALVRPLELQMDGSSRGKGKNKSEVLEDDDRARYRGTGKKQPVASTNGVAAQEEVPLMTLTGDRDTTSIIAAHATDKEQQARAPILFFYSTPNMHNSTISPLSTTGKKDKKQKSSEKVTQQAGGRARSNTLDSLNRTRSPKMGPRADKTAATTQPRPRAHAPLGLAFISMSDANLNRIREDVHLPFSRKDIHLSGPLALSEDKNQKIHVQNMRSLGSVDGKDKDIPGLARPRGIWACLPSSARDTLEEMLSLSILKDKRYWFVLMGNFFCMIGFYVPFVYVPDRAKQIGIEEDKAAFLLSIIGITNTVGRVLTGVVINFLNIDCLLVTSLALALAGIVTAACPLCHSYASLATLSAIFGVCVAAYISLCSVLLCELLGVENLTNAFGFVILFRGVACIMGPPIAGALIDATGIFDPSFYIGGGMIVLGAVCHALLLIPYCRRQKPKSV